MEKRGCKQPRLKRYNPKIHQNKMRNNYIFLYRAKCNYGHQKSGYHVTQVLNVRSLHTSR